MSKFWGKDSDESEESSEDYSSSQESSSSEESSGYSSDSSTGSSGSSDSDGSGKGASRFLMGSSDSDDEDEVRVVKSAKAKAHEDLDKICDELRDSMAGNEWAAIQTLWDKLHKQVDKIKKTTGMLGTPRPYIKIVTELEDFLAETLAEKPKLSPTNAKALSRMKLAIKKNNSVFAEQIQAYRENPETPVVSSESEQSEVESDAESLDSEAEAERQFERTVRTGVIERPKDKVMSMPPEEITYDVVQKKLGEVAAARGRVTALDRQDQVEMLSFLFGVAHGAAQKIEVLVHKITVIFDMNNPMTSPMTIANWKT